MPRIRFGITIDGAPQMLLKADYNAIRDIAVQCQDLDYDSLWVMDHLSGGKDEKGAIFEAWTLLSALSTETHGIKLGTLVACNSYRNPSLTAKIASTFDVISKGRLILGYGAGWKKNEYESYGFPFLDPSTRVQQLREGIIILKKLWTEERSSFNGEHYKIKDAICEPKPVQKPHPPIIVGGGGKHTLKVAAELGDGWDSWGVQVDEYKRRIDVLTTYCDDLGRRIEDLELSWSGDMFLFKDEYELNRKMEEFKIQYQTQYQTQYQILCTYDNCVKKLQEYIDLGCSHFIFSLRSFNGELEEFRDRIVPSFR